MTREDRKRWKAFKEIGKETITHEEFKMICEVHANMFNHKYHTFCSCNGRKAQQWINEINEVYARKKKK